MGTSGHREHTSDIENEPGYAEARSGAVFSSIANAGLITVSGADRVDFLQRQTTNDVSQLGPDQSLTTVLTSPKARILDVLTLVQNGDSITALSLPERGAATTAFFRKRIFFMDKVIVEDESGLWAQFELDGPQASDCLVAVGMSSVPEPNGTGQLDLVGTRMWVIERRGLAGRGFRLAVPKDGAVAVSEVLEANGAVSLPGDLFEVLRVEAGLPGPAGELIDAHTPLEIGLREVISSTKGCYTGQEVIARQITYDKVVRSLHGVRLSAPADLGSRVLIDGKPAGQLTSSVQSPQFGPIALAVLRNQSVGLRQTVEIQQDGQLIAAELAALPFS